MNDGIANTGWSGRVAPCPHCGQGIPESAVACPYCGSRFTVTRSGYCPQCRAMTSASTTGTCEKCGSEMMDVQVERATAGAQASLATRSVQDEVAAGSAAPWTATATVTPRGVTADTGTKDAVGIVSSGLMRAGATLLALAPIGLIVLLGLQWTAAQGWVSGLSTLWSDEIFVATRGREAYVMGLAFLVMPVVAICVCLAGMTLFPRVGRGLRIAGNCVGLLGVAGLVVALWRSVVTDGQGNAPWMIALGSFAVLLVGLVLVQTGSRSARRTMRNRPHVKVLYRPRGLRTRLWIGVVLWLAGLVSYLVIVLREVGDWEIRRGGYALGGLLALGLVGALLHLIGRRRRPSVWIDREGNIVEPVST